MSERPNAGASAKGSSAMQKRFEMPMGAKPAAKVLRSSGNNALEEEPAAEESQRSEEEEEPQKPLMGSIVERPRRPKTGKQGAKEGADPKRLSRFNKSRQTGFPTTKDVPLGSLVAPNKAPDLVAPEKQQEIIPSSTKSEKGDARQASANDAEAMLAEMSLAEIQESVKELQNSLDPSMIAFLKKRGKKKAIKAATPGKKDVVYEDAATLPSHGNDSKEPTGDHENTTNVDEKARMAQVLSSIQTFDDLDTAYESYQQNDNQDANDTNDSSKNPIGKVPMQASEDDFGIACGLLRSTSPHQTLWASRVVCRHLQQNVQSHGSAFRLVPQTETTRQAHWPFPILLPVSLRCLLDANLSYGSGGMMLQTTYVLQSLYALLQLRACSDHVVDITGMDESNEAVCYQLNCLDDAVPSPSLISCYAASQIRPVAPEEAKNVSLSSEVAGAAYSTSASPTNAQADADAFLRDPMWTLLSRMRILPRISSLLRRGKSTTADSDMLPKESLIAICGILAMIGQRSPGAASAIVQHNSLLDDLTSICWIKAEGSLHFEPSFTLPTIVLLCSLARQSRVAAEGLSKRMVESSFVLEVISLKQTSSLAEHRLQQWTLILWRTFLRYGLGFAVLPTILTLAGPHLTLGPNTAPSEDRERTEPTSEHSPFDLSPEFYSCFRAVLHCIQALDKSAEEKGYLLSENYTSIIANAGVWMSSSKQQAIRRLHAFSEAVPTNFSLRNCYCLRSAAAIFGFLSTLFEVASDSSSEASTGEFKAEEITMAEEERCVDSLNELVQTNFMRDLLRSILPLITISSFDKAPVSDLENKKIEACGSIFLDSFIAFVSSLDRRCTKLASDVGEGIIRQKVEKLTAKVEALLTERISPKIESKASHSGRVRRHWLNRVHVSIASFLNESRNFQSSGALTMKEIVYSAIGRLQLGEERDAVVLFGYNKLMWPNECSAFAKEPSPISTVLVRELCRTPRARYQLDHSFRLSGALGLSPDGSGAFGLLSLLSESEDGEPGGNKAEHLLPVGEVWLWQLLSGSVVLPQPSIQEGAVTSEASSVLLTCLQIINELESSDDADRYANRFKTGAKLYYVVTICLHPEAILSSDQITELASSLLDEYIGRFAPEDAKAFGEVCRTHAATKILDKPEEVETYLSADEEEKVKAILDPTMPKDCGFPSATVKTIEGLLNDMCDAFLDYGAQYPFFTKCIRLFLANCFPSKIRSTVIQRLRGALHLLSLPDDANLINILPVFLAGGLPTIDNSARDSPEILDSVASVFTRGTNIRPDDTFFMSWTVGMLARSFADSLSLGGKTGLSAAKRRIWNLEDSVFLRVVETTALLLLGNGTRQEVVVAAAHRDPSKLAQLSIDFSMFVKRKQDTWWEEMSKVLHSLANSSAQS